MSKPLADGLPEFPWDRLASAAAIAQSHPDGIVDLSIGTPVDSTPQVVMDALQLHADAPGYPTALGILDLRQAWAHWAKRIVNADVDVNDICPLLGSKELVAWLPIVLGLGSDDVVAIPELAYPTYAVGALMAGAQCVTYADADSIPSSANVIWVNTPSNPTGQVLNSDELRNIVRRGRDINAVVISDECYIELGWDKQPISILDDEVTQGDHSGLLSVHSLSKRSNLAGYRSAAVFGDARLVTSIVSLRKHAGMLMPTPIQHASIAALHDDAHVAAQKSIYGRRRELLRTALSQAGFQISHSEAGLYLWATRDESCMETVSWLAQRGILVAPGDFYGASGSAHVRVALTGTDERIAAAIGRL
ncbi:MAG: succinyldiaminopimelate transaminase [Actinobacteria bacterium]|uniref:Unannotated protein n=1 Tax=freshwater metagenome TaxID=449393 RepID=A0A6J5YRS8_9ZZZZ|nr:succinyldiaminopimelate transaminase [Actinomycetota bacterium]